MARWKKLNIQVDRKWRFMMIHEAKIIGFRYLCPRKSLMRGISVLQMKVNLFSMIRYLFHLVQLIFDLYNKSL